MAISNRDYNDKNMIGADAEWRVGIVTAKFNEKITSKLLEGALRQLRIYDWPEDRIFSVEVPGAYEIPLAAKWLLENQCDGVIALGAVIRGETSHYDYVCSAVERGCTMLQLETGKPVVFGVLTTDNEEQAANRIGGSHGHKGEDAAHVLLEMLNLKKSIKDQTLTLKGEKHGRS